ncbi:Ig-like domain-containing protein [Alloscardovia criceti]|uniref:Ig-like domain-containing protein n=1 Tax=Alloscardovia criceti TaxID=356828 RepID=UPI0014615272|nr:Ig-like domain-containing protein [Alloscardovia criceti]
MNSTKPEQLTPLASGFRADDSGTAPYDSYTTNNDDLDALHKAREAAQQLIDEGSTDETALTQAQEKLTTAFNSVRFIYHYTAITGTNGMRIFDNNGNLIQAHGAGFVTAQTSTLATEDQYIDANHDGKVYIWMGEDKTDRLIAHGVRIYYSDDLMNWIDKGRGFETYLGDKDLQEKLNGSDPVYQKFYNTTSMQSDPDYTNIYGNDFTAFSKDSSNSNISNAGQALDHLLWDLKALKGDGSNPTLSSAVFERPKMAYNEKTGRWVIWFHADGPLYGDETKATYSKAKAGVAISVDSNPAGPYKYLGSFRLSPGNNANNPGMARDMNLWIDDKDANHDGVNDAYLVYSSNENRDLTISLLDSTYTKLVVPNAQQKRGTDIAAGATYNIVATDSRESPAPFKWNGKYHIIYSHTTGWAPNENEYISSETDNFLGPYVSHKTPFIKGDGYQQNPSNSFYTQSSYVIPVDQEAGKFIYWGDRWFNPDTGADISQSRYVMTPLQMEGDNVKIHPHGDWTLDTLNQYEAVKVTTPFPTETGSMSELMKSLPQEIDIVRGSDATPTTTKVTWDHYYGPDQPAGKVTVNGTLSNPQGARISFTVTVYPKNTVLFIDSGSSAENESDYYNSIRANAPDLMNKTTSDQPYSQGTWGYTSAEGEDGDIQKYGTSSNDIYDTGWYANKGKNIDYKADLPAGTYTVTAGVKDWWAQWNNRTVQFVISDNSGTILAKDNVNAKQASSTKPLKFTLAQAQTVTFSAQKSSVNNLDPILNWINVIRAGDDEVVSAESTGSVGVKEGENVKLPDSVNVSLADGTTQKRSVSWEEIPHNVQPFMPAYVRGTVDGTTLPATATVYTTPDHLEYFIDVNSDQSPAYAAIDDVFDNALVNRTSDQADNGTWGNTSKDYGTQNTNSDNPYLSGLYAGKSNTNRPLSYRLTLSPGKHTVSVAMHDWWNHERLTTITYTVGDSEAQDFATATATQYNAIATNTIEITGDAPQSVEITLTSEHGTGPVLSWISSRRVIESTPEPDSDTPPDSNDSDNSENNGENQGETPKTNDENNTEKTNSNDANEENSQASQVNTSKKSTIALAETGSAVLALTVVIAVSLVMGCAITLARKIS